MIIDMNMTLSSVRRAEQWCARVIHGNTLAVTLQYVQNFGNTKAASTSSTVR